MVAVMSSWYQLKAILWKNWLQKKAHMAGFAAEILLPVAFMGLLILIKQITNIYDSPNVAYFCGQTYPWFYSDTVDNTNPLANSGPLQCTQKPAQCTAENYYQSSIDIPFTQNNHITAYREYGYIDTPSTAGEGSNPFYAFMVGGSSSFYNALGLENPSLPLCEMLEKIQTVNAWLAVAPNSEDESAPAAQFYDYLMNYDCIEHDIDFNRVLHYFQSQSDLESYVTDKNYDDVGVSKVAFAYIINSANTISAQWDYTIRVNYTGPVNQKDPTVACLYGGDDCSFRYTIPSTKFYTLDLLKPQLSMYMFGYSYSGFSTLQLVIDEYILSKYGGKAPNIQPSVSLMPTASFKSDDFQYVIASTLGIFYMLSFLYPVSRIIRGLVVEKELRIKEGMKMMGLTDTVYNLSWLITTVIQMTLVSILITLISSTTVFEYSNKFFVFLYFEAFSLAIICMCFLLATLFSRSKTASLLGPMIFFATFFPYYSVNDAQYSESSKTATCLLAPACFALGANVFADYEGGLVGVQASNVNQQTSNFTYSTCIGMLFFDAFFYGILAFYLDKVFPSEFGTSLPFYFPLMPSYWCGESLHAYKDSYGGPVVGWLMSFFDANSYRKVSGTRGGGDDHLQSNLVNNDIESIDPKRSQYYEPVSSELRQQIEEEKCISIRQLRKVFKNPAGGDDRVAVAGLNLDMFQNQVTVLLGHNGAGKTTTISMLVGMIPATAGNAIMPGGLDIQHDMATIRKGLGVCPQHDILFPELTAFEHLQIFAAFKGVLPGQVESEARKMIAEVGLKEKAASKASTLSGGQKRKLSLGIALIGDSKVVILDEPTSGMDPFSRRSTWNIIQRNKKGRVILLTTHFMDEADLLGDRVAIMAHGKLQCCGSPLFLKNRYGVGYTLTIVKESQAKVDSAHLQQISAAIRSLVQSFIPNADPLSDVGAEQSFRLPFSASERFVDLFRALDDSKSRLTIAEYGVSVTTLEEVFLRVADLEHSEEEGEGEDETSPTFGNPLTRKQTNTGNNEPGSVTHFDEVFKAKKDEKQATTQYAATESLLARANYQEFEDSNPFWKHFKALLLKRAIYGKRDTRMLICQVILPVLLVIIGLSLLLIQPDLNQPDMILSPAKFNEEYSYSQQNFVPFSSPSKDVCEVCSEMESAFQGVSDSGVWGVAMPISTVAQTDAFAGCAVGASVLNNVSQYLINTPQADLDTESGSTIYGTVTLAEETDTENLVYNVLVNGSALHGTGIFMNLVHQSYLQAITGIPTATITAHNHPLPETYKQENQSASIDAFVVALFCMIAFCFIPASFAVFVVKEREVKAKHQQVISGVSIYAYWTSTFLWDCVSYIPTALLVVAIMYAYGIDAYTKGSAASAVVVLLLLYGPATAAITYMISFLFVSHSTAQVVVMFFNFLSGLCLMVVSFVLTAIPSTAQMNLQLRYFFRLFPSFCLGDGILQLALCQDGKDCPSIDKNGYNSAESQSPFAWDTAGGDIVFLAVEAIVYFAIAILIEYLLTFPSLLAWLYRIDDPGVTTAELAEDDPDVATERSRVLLGQADHDIIKISELRKLYPANASRAGGIDPLAICCPPSMNNSNGRKNIKVAVHSLSFGIPKGECFGFLGINGAGKTTTLSILSGEFPPTSGQAYVDGFSISADQSKIRRKIGYCPQFDALLELLTVREHLELYGRIKGLEGAALEEVVVRKMQQLDLVEFENKTAGSLSGGNKRKLSVAVATVGDPPIVFLDEPSTGMDPKARRFMWKVIARMSTQDAHCSVILTTHSMEEAEALCTRIGIMVNGRLRCLGSSQHLKHRFGNGFEVNFKMLTPSDEAMAAALQTIQARTTVGAQYTQNPVQQTASAPSTGKELLDRMRIASNEFQFVAQALGNLQRLQEIVPFASGAMIHELAQGDGSVSARIFLEWWLSEDIFQNLRLFIETEFGTRAQLLERSGAHTCRYRIKKVDPRGANGSEKASAATASSSSGEENHLSEIFAKIEAKKVALHVQEYSVGQTTLEQIFNQFASQQDNPEVAMMLAAGDGRESLSRGQRNSVVRVD